MRQTLNLRLIRTLKSFENNNSADRGSMYTQFWKTSIKTKYVTPQNYTTTEKNLVVYVYCRICKCKWHPVTKSA